MGRGFALFAGAAPEIIRASAREAEGLGYSSFWVNHPGATDGLAALALAAKETRRIELGIGVIPLHTRGPDSIVQGVRANALPLGRLPLGVGSPNPGALAPEVGKWQGVVDEIVLRAITGTDTVEENVALLRAAKPLE